MRFHSKTSFLHALPTNWRSDCRKNRRMKNHRMRRMRPLFIHDGVERPIRRPSDKVDRELYYSGKKKRHTLKNVLIIDEFGSIHFLSDTYEGRVHDKCIADEAGYTLPNASMLYQDAGFQGFNLPGVQMMQPKKKPRNGTLTPQEKEENRRISSVRVRIEHVIGDIKRYRIIHDIIRFRGRSENRICGIMMATMPF